MRSDSGEEASQCHCCKPCKDCKDFHKVVDLKDKGLVIYRHKTRTEDINTNTGLIETTTDTEDVFIFHNTKNVEITSADFVPEFGQNKIRCPRCRNIIKHAQKLLEKVPAIDKKDIMGVCDHCRMKDRSRSSCYECEETVKKFIDSRSTRKEETEERVKTWLSKIKHLLSDVIVDEGGSKKEKHRAHSELYLDTLCRDSPRSVRKPEVKQKIHPDTHRSDDTEISQTTMQSIKQILGTKKHPPRLHKLEKSVIFIDTAKPQLNTLIKGTDKSILESDQIFKNLTYVDREISKSKYYDAGQQNAAAKDLYTLPSHDIGNKAKQPRLKSVTEHKIPIVEKSQTDTMRTEYESGVKLEGYLRQISKPLKDGKYEDAVSQIDDYNKYIPLHKYSEKSLRHPQETKQKSKSNFKSYADNQDNVFQTSKSERPRIDLKHVRKGFESSSRFRKFHSEEALVTTVSGVTDDFNRKDFSYIFPKELKKVETIRCVSSSELIKNTREVLLARADEEKKKVEEERKKKLEEEAKKRIVREEKNKLAEEKRRLEEENKRLEEKQIIIGKTSKLEKKEGSDEKKRSQKGKLTPSVSSKSKPKDSHTALEISKEPKIKSEPKESKTDKEALKAEKEVEKARKEQEKNEIINKEKEEKQKLKEEKEEKLRREKDEKQRPKEEKEEKYRREKDEKNKDQRKKKKKNIEGKKMRNNDKRKKKLEEKKMRNKDKRKKKLEEKKMKNKDKRKKNGMETKMKSKDKRKNN